MKNNGSKILFLNPPSTQQVFRDCYCSDISKGPFFIHPLDLQVQSGWFAQAGYEIEFIDAVIEHADAEEITRRILLLKADVVLSLIGEAVYENDCRFLNELAIQNPNQRLFLTGDIARFEPQKVFDAIPRAEGILMDFTSAGLLQYLEGSTHEHLMTRESNGSAVLKKGSYSHPVASEKFAGTYTYQLPFFRTPRYYSLLSSYGCPFRCAYCNVHQVGYGVRETDSVLEEMRLATRLRFKSLYWRDPTFMVDKKRTFDLFDAWRAERFSFEWIAYTRPDVVDEEIIRRAAEMGCGTLLFGVETYDEKSLKQASREMESEKVRSVFELARKYGVRTASFILVGMTEQIKAESPKFSDMTQYEKRLSTFLDSLDPDYISLNVFHERPGVKANTPILQAMESQREALRVLASRITRRFYLHPRRIARNLVRLLYPKQWGLLLKIVYRLILPAR
jgi:radical SAM superfamily enzyme YgiQ (UPF0313 family)